MKRLLKALIASLLIFGALTACQVEQTEEGELPDVQVKVEGETKLPEYDVDVPEVDVTTEEKTVKIPDIDVDVDSKDATVTVPKVDVKTPTEEGYDDGESETDSDDGEGGQNS